MNWLLHWLAVHTGSSNTSGAPRNYNFWSGFGSDIGEVTIIGGMVAIYRKHTCHEPRCWRLGHHPVEGTPFQACRKHHPTLKNEKPKRGHMTIAYHAARQPRVKEGM